MKTYIALIATTLVASAYASSSCWSEKYGYECCSPTFHPFKTIDYRQGIWSFEGDKWCGILNGGVDASKPCWSHKLRYPCCSRLYNIEVLADESGSWGVENGDWCGVVEDEECWANQLGYPCCAQSSTEVQFENSSYQWGMEDGLWCGIIQSDHDDDDVDDVDDDEEKETYSIQGENPFKNKLYINPDYVKLVDEAIKEMTNSEMISKAEKMKEYPNAIWLNYIIDIYDNDKLESNLKKSFKRTKGIW